MNDSIGLYLNDIGKVALLTAEDERELSKAIEAGRDALAREA
ncbi:MAG: polymerase sigma factor HrdD, partial [Actinomycetota bacterium]